MTTQNQHFGSCHCGAVRYRVELDLSRPVIECNCSICSRTGTRLAFAPAEAFTLERGEENLTDYLWGKKQIHHLFCKTCGVRSFARGIDPKGNPVVAINVRCLEDLDPATLQIQHFDGKSY